MRLNEYAKRAILRSIVADIPKPSVEAARIVIQAALLKGMSPLARKLYKQNPAALTKDHIGYDHGFEYTSMVVVGDADFAAVMKPYVEAKDQRRDVYNKLKGIIDGCTTLKQLKTLLPEFEKDLPTEEAPTKNLPAVANVVADLTKLGWPKGTQQ